MHYNVTMDNIPLHSFCMGSTKNGHLVASLISFVNKKCTLCLIMIGKRCIVINGRIQGLFLILFLNFFSHSSLLHQIITNGCRGGGVFLINCLLILYIFGFRNAQWIRSDYDRVLSFLYLLCSLGHCWKDVFTTLSVFCYYVLHIMYR